MDEAFANSFATACTIFSSAHCDEFIHSEYLSRFYYVIQQGLRFYQGDEVCSIFSIINERNSLLATFSYNYRIYSIE